MATKSKTKAIGILTAGGDCPGLNPAIRGVVKPALNEYGMKVYGFLDGFKGLAENRYISLENPSVSGILTLGGTILGTSRVKIHKMEVKGKPTDMTKVAAENLAKLNIDCLVCLGGGGTQKNAYRLHKSTGVKVLTLPKTIDNDVWGTDLSFGYDTACEIATEAIDRLHTTATSHHRVIVCEIMGNKAGWLTLRSGIAGGADVILIPELPYDLNVVAKYVLNRRKKGSRFSIIAVAEGALSIEDFNAQEKARKKRKKDKKYKDNSDEDNDSNELDPRGALIQKRIDGEDVSYHIVQEPIASRLARQLQEKTGIEVRLTSLGHVQRGGIPSSFDRWLCTRLGTKAAQLLANGVYNSMVGYHGGVCNPVPLEDVAGVRKVVPPEEPMLKSARLVGTCLGVD